MAKILVKVCMVGILISWSAFARTTTWNCVSVGLPKALEGRATFEIRKVVEGQNTTIHSFINLTGNVDDLRGNLRSEVRINPNRMQIIPNSPTFTVSDQRNDRENNLISIQSIDDLFQRPVGAPARLAFPGSLIHLKLRTDNQTFVFVVIKGIVGGHATSPDNRVLNANVFITNENGDRSVALGNVDFSCFHRIND